MGLFDWLADQGSRESYQVSRANNAIAGLWGGGVQNYDPSKLNALGTANQAGESGGNDFGNTLLRTGEYAGAGAALGSAVPIVGNVLGGGIGAGVGVFQSLFGGEDAAHAQDQIGTAQNNALAAQQAQNQGQPTPGSTQPGTPNATTAPGAAQAASDQAGATAARTNGLYGLVNGTQNALTPAMIAAGQNNAFNQPMMSANAEGRAASDAFNQSGHAGGYGDATQAAINAGAGVQAQANIANYGLQVAGEQNAFNQNKAQALDQINTNGNQAFQDYSNLLGQYTGSNQFQQQLATNTANMQNANYGQLESGALQGAATLASSPTASANVGKLVNWVGQNVVQPAAQGLTGAYNSVTGAGSAPPDSGPSQYRALGPDTPSSGQGPLTTAFGNSMGQPINNKPPRSSSGSGGNFSRGW